VCHVWGAKGKVDCLEEDRGEWLGHFEFMAQRGDNCREVHAEFNGGRVVTLEHMVEGFTCRIGAVRTSSSQPMFTSLLLKTSGGWKLVVNELGKMIG
jgi:hypothetical protein